jgi:DNA-binding transcriptional ArsR family regulator
MTDKDAAKVARALAHPERIAILRDLRDYGEPVSPVDFARRNRGVLLGNASYQFTALRKLGVTAIASRRQVRGSRETFHRIGGPRGTLALLMLAAIDAARSD